MTPGVPQVVPRHCTSAVAAVVVPAPREGRRQCARRRAPTQAPLLARALVAAGGPRTSARRTRRWADGTAAAATTSAPRHRARTPRSLHDRHGRVAGCTATTSKRPAITTTTTYTPEVRALLVPDRPPSPLPRALPPPRLASAAVGRLRCGLSGGLLPQLAEAEAGLRPTTLRRRARRPRRCQATRVAVGEARRPRNDFTSCASTRRRLRRHLEAGLPRSAASTRRRPRRQ